jgi:hypothetical protein
MNTVPTPKVWLEYRLSDAVASSAESLSAFNTSKNNSTRLEPPIANGLEMRRSSEVAAVGRGGLVAEQRLDFLPQRLIPIAGLLQKRTARVWRTLQRPMIEIRDPVASF